MDGCKGRVWGLGHGDTDRCNREVMVAGFCLDHAESELVDLREQLKEISEEHTKVLQALQVLELWSAKREA